MQTKIAKFIQAQKILTIRADSCLQDAPMSPFTNLLGDVPTDSPDELVQTLLKLPPVRIERIVSYGHHSPNDLWYDQPENEWVLLIAGAARLRLEDEIIEMTPGSFVNIPAHRRHRVDWTDPKQATIWLAVWW